MENDIAAIRSDPSAAIPTSTARHSLNADLRIVARINGAGIDRDVRLLTEALTATGRSPVFSAYRSISPLRRVFGRSPKDDCILFVERVTARWLRSARRFVLVPNQERYPHRLVPLLRHVDHIFCKSRHATEVFGALHPSVHHIGFTSVDRRLSGVDPDYGRCLHMAGGSSVKGTDALLRVWSRHPEWPELILLQHKRKAPGTVPANVRLITDYLPDGELQQLQNRCGLHLCPSSSEGWGHYLVEAMSCAAVTLTTDGPPMNELIQPERGVLVAHARQTPRKLGTDFHVDLEQLERAISDLLALPVADKQRMGAAARQWFEQNDRRFRERLSEVLSVTLGRG